MIYYKQKKFDFKIKTYTFKLRLDYTIIIYINIIVQRNTKISLFPRKNFSERSFVITMF